MEMWQYPLSFFIAVCVVIVDVGASNASPRPNVVIFIADDLGYGDLGCFGNTTIRTPHLDKLSTQGVKLTHSIAAGTMCSPSRAALLTGRYPIRSGMTSSHEIDVMIVTASAGGLPASEVTIGEVAKKAGYSTGFLGKWHQGWSVDRSDPDHKHPLNQGFDYFYGIPLTNQPEFGDPKINGGPVFVRCYPNVPFQLMLTFILVLISTLCLVRVGYLHPCLAVLFILVTGLVCGTVLFVMYNAKFLNSHFFRNYDLVEQPIHLPSVTRKLVKEGEEFLQARHADQAPFLLIVSWLHVHTALETAPQFRGRSSHGPYGDAVEEMDWGTGQLLDTLEQYGMADSTLVYFTSDHGGSSYATDLMGNTVGGFNGPFSGVKGEGSTEGSFRVPGIFRWSGHFPAGLVVDEPVSLLDVMPTLAELLGFDLDGELPEGHVIDGASLVPLLTGQESVSPHEFLFHYCRNSVHAVTYRPREDNKKWKLMLREPDPSIKIFTQKCNGAFHLSPPKLYDLTLDPTAASPLDVVQHSDIVSIILKALKQHQDSVQEVPYQMAWLKLMWQPWKQPCCNFPQCACEDEKFKGMFTD